MSKCIVKECNKWCTRFVLPTQEDVKLIWLERSGNKSSNLTRRKQWRICPLHFQKQCFSKFEKDEGKLLKKFSLPSLFLPNYSMKGDITDNFLFPVKVEAPIQQMSHKIIDDMPSSHTDYPPVGKVKMPTRKYERKLTKIDAIPSTSKGVEPFSPSPHVEVLSFFKCEGIMPTLEADTDNPSTLHNEFIIKEETSLQCLSNQPNILDCSSKVFNSTNLKNVDILEKIEIQNPDIEFEYVDIKIENDYEIVDEPDNEIDDNTSDDLIGVCSSLEAKYNDLYKENQLLKHLLTKVGEYPNLECYGEYTINTDYNHLLDPTDIQNICRVCLQKSDNLIFLIEQMVFENKNIPNMTILEALQSIICDKVDIADNPRQICTQCLNHLKSFVMFKYTFNRATSILHIFANGTFINTNKQSVPASTMEYHDSSKNNFLRDEKCFTKVLETSENYANTNDLSVLSKNSEDFSKLGSPTRRNIFRYNHLTHDQFKCEKCHRSFKKKSSLLSHMMVHTKKFPFKCVKCGKGFVIRSNYECHLLTHEDGKLPHKCIECGKCFSNPIHLSRHMTIHTKNRTYSTKYRFKRCKYCGEGFSNKEQLVEHFCHQYGVHKCKYCFKVFLNPRTRQLHTLKVHVNGNKIPGYCSICNLMFKNIYYHKASKHQRKK